jgi:Ca2+-transporting ATPase
MVLLLVAAALVSLLVGSGRDSLAILAIVCLFVLLGFVQEYRAERAMRALKRMALPTVRVRRNGVVWEVSAAELAPGDIVLLEAGNLVPADCRLLEVHDLKMLESILTGESGSVAKTAGVLRDETLPLGDRCNMVYLGTTVVHGRAVALVVATGMGSELGRIAGLVQDVEVHLTPLQKRLDVLGKTLALGAIAVSLLVCCIGLMQGEDPHLMLMTAISLAVAAIPEGLPAVVTITLAIGSRDMLRRKALIRHLSAVEALGSVTVICSDKTGTLTENRMEVTDIVPTAATVCHAGGGDGAFDPEKGRRRLLASAVLCNDAVLREPAAGGGAVGDPTEIALLAAAAANGLTRAELELRFPRVDETPFDSSARMMLTAHDIRDRVAAVELGFPAPPEVTGLVVVKGATDAVLAWCHATGDSLPPDRMALAEADRLAAQGKRVLAVGCGCRMTGTGDIRYGEFFGLIAMMDPLRPEAPAAVARCRQAGIRPVLITGDHPLTATAVAAALGVGAPERVLSGADLVRLGPDELADAARDVSVYARVSPEHKLLIVEALQKRGEVVAMTGDGVNDAPALRKADIGVAMGGCGTDVARDAAGMVLLDDNFATIVAAVEKGRTIYDNIRRFILFSVSGNLGKILAVVTLPLLGLPIPLTPLQLLWLNLLTDGLLGLGMGMEPAEPDVMVRPPVPSSARIFDAPAIRRAIITGAAIGGFAIAVAWYFWHVRAGYRQGEWRTVLFSALVSAQVGQALALRSFRTPLWRIGLMSNRVLLAMIAAVVLLQGAVVYLPPLAAWFGTVPLFGPPLGAALLPGAAVYALLEYEKRRSCRS